MTHQTKSADLARVYRAIGNSTGMTMPKTIDAGEFTVAMVFARNDVSAVRAWAEALGGCADHGATHAAGTGGSDNEWHMYGNEYGGGDVVEWLGWRITVRCYVDGPQPTRAAALGTGDEPAEEAIVPSETEDCDDCEGTGYNCLVHRAENAGTAS